MRNKIKQETLRLKATSRGGGIEISLDKFGFKTERMSAYQNYLGGGMLGSIQNDCTKENWRAESKLLKIAEELNRYFHSLTNHECDEWECATYEEQQQREASAY